MPKILKYLISQYARSSIQFFDPTQEWIILAPSYASIWKADRFSNWEFLQPKITLSCDALYSACRPMPPSSVVYQILFYIRVWYVYFTYLLAILAWHHTLDCFQFSIRCRCGCILFMNETVPMVLKIIGSTFCNSSCGQA